MNEFLKQHDVSRAKLAVIVGLVVLFAAVWGNALLPSGRAHGRRSASATKSSAQPSEKPAKEKIPAEVKQAGSPTTNTRKPPRVPQKPVNLLQVTSRDPFARPGWALSGPPEAGLTVRSLSEREAALEQLRSAGVSAVVLSDSGKIATVGGRRVRPGDLLMGYQVLDITPAGIVLSDEPVADRPF